MARVLVDLDVWLDTGGTPWNRWGTPPARADSAEMVEALASLRPTSPACLGLELVYLDMEANGEGRVGGQRPAGLRLAWDLSRPCLQYPRSPQRWARSGYPPTFRRS